MAFIELDKAKLKHNYEFLEKTLEKYGKSWAVITKLLCGNELYLKELLSYGMKEVGDSRISNLKTIKKINSEVQTIYIKPPAKKSIPNVVKYADVSFNSELETIKLLAKEAQKQGKVHKVIIMIELGDLREGVMGDELLDFYRKVFRLKGIMISGIGTNLNCLSGVLPSMDKLIQLSLYKQLIEATFKREIPWVTGGTSIVLPLLTRKQVPAGVNHFRVGETLYFGNNLLTGKPVKGMKQDVLKLHAEIIELHEKPKIPTGKLAEDPQGNVFEVDSSDFGKTSYRAILDIGLLDINPDYLIPDDKKIKVIGESSDMLILDMGDSRRKYEIGSTVSFGMKYMGALRLLNSDYVEKKLI